MEKRKSDYVEIHKFCFKCGKEKVIKAMAKRGQYKTIMEIIKSVYLCDNCSPRFGETFGSLETILSILHDETPKSFFKIEQ